MGGGRGQQQDGGDGRLKGIYKFCCPASHHSSFGSITSLSFILEVSSNNSGIYVVMVTSVLPVALLKEEAEGIRSGGVLTTPPTLVLWF